MACDYYRCLKCGSTQCITWRLFTAAGGGSIKGSKSQAYLSAPTVCSQYTSCVRSYQTISLRKGIASKAAFGTAALTLSLQAVLAESIASGAAFGTHTFKGFAEILPSGFLSEAFGDIQIGGLFEVFPSSIASGETVGTPTFGTWLIGPGGIISGGAFGTHTLIPGVATLLPTGITSGLAFGTPDLVNVFIYPTGIASVQAFGTPALNALAHILPTSIASGGAFGTHTFGRGVVSISPTNIPTGQSFGTPLLNALAHILPTGITSGQAFGTHALSKLAHILPTGIASGAAFGTHTVGRGVVTILPSGVVSGLTFGSHTIARGAVIIIPTGIATGGAFGSHTVTPGVATILPSGIVSGATFGTADLNTLHISPTGIASGAAFGSAALSVFNNILPTSIGSFAAFGTPGLVILGYLLPTGIATGQVFGSTTVAGGGSISANGIGSAAAFGTTTVVNLSNLVVSGIASGLTFGTHDVHGFAQILPSSITSGLAFGTPDLDTASAFPLVENFSFTQFDSTDFEYNWESFTSDRVLYLEISWDGVSWQDFSWIDDTETGPYQQTANVLSGWPEAGDDFVPLHTYYMRVRYQDQYPAPTAAGGWTVLSFDAEASPMTFNLVGDLSGQQPNVYVRDLTNGFELYQRNPDTVFDFPASVTKMMTALLAYEHHSGDWTTATITLTTDDCAQPIPGLTLDMAGFQAGDVVTWEDLGYALFLPSSCEACQAFGRVVGNELYAAAGNTGTQGLTRFIERMNARAAELGMTNTTYTDTFGGSKTFGPDVLRNRISARDLNILTEEVLSHAVLRTTAGTPTHGANVTGGRSFTLSLVNYNRFINGPTFNPSGTKDANVAGGKDGVWNISGTTNHSKSIIWTSPAGYDVAITTLGSQSMYGCMLDQRGIMYSLVRDYPYLSEGVGNPADPYFNNVAMLVGADGSIVDESRVARSLTVNSVSVGDPIIKDSTGSMVYDNLADYVSAADAGDLNIGSSDATIELWYTGPGFGVGEEYVFFSKGRHTPTVAREWLVNMYVNQLQLFISTDGTNWANTNAINLDSSTNPVFFNGAPRHLALVKSGTTWALYIDGERGNNTLTGNPADTDATVVIGYNATAVSFKGRADEFRFTIGTARYTANMVALDPRKFSRSLTLLPTAITTGQALGSHTVTIGAAVVAPAGIASGASFGTHTIGRGAVTVSPSSITSGQAFGTATVEADGGGALPTVSGFSFTQVDNADFQYDWAPFSSDRVIYLDISWDNVSWAFFSWIDSTETGPYTQTAHIIAGWPEAGDDFVDGHVYYMRVRYQDQYPDAITVGDFTTYYFVAGSATVVPPITDLAITFHDDSDMELAWTESGTYYTYIEDTAEDGQFRLDNWYNPGDDGFEHIDHTDVDLSLRPFQYGVEYFVRMRYQNAPGNGTPTAFGPWATVSFVGDVIPPLDLGFRVEQENRATFTAYFPSQPNLNVVIQVSIDGGSYNVAFSGSAAIGQAPMDFGEGFGEGQVLRFKGVFNDGLGNDGPAFAGTGYFELVVT